MCKCKCTARKSIAVAAIAVFLFPTKYRNRHRRKYISMLRNYFVIAIRNLLKNKGFTFINISGLAVGMACTIMIMLWVESEITYDGFHENKDRIYEAWNRDTFSGALQCWNTTPKVLAKYIRQDFPEVQDVVRVDWGAEYLFSYKEKRIKESGNIVDSGFLNMFSFPLLKGNKATALNGSYNIVLSASFAKKIFGDEDPMGKILKVENRDNFTVTGIMQDAPDNTRFKYSYLIPWSYGRLQGYDDENWGNNSTRNYVLLKPNASIEGLQAKIKNIRRKYDSDSENAEMFLYPMSRWRLYSNFTGGKEDGGLINMVQLFIIIASLILLIACINFMNLSTARSEKRAREVGIRKVVGARRIGLITQFISESVLMALLAGILSIGIVLLAIPGFNTLADKNLLIDFTNAWYWFAFIGVILITGLLAGSYPAFFLSSFKPVKVLKGLQQQGARVITPRKVLVVLQFTFAIVLIVSTLVIRKQVGYAQSRETGYNKKNLAYHFITGDLDKNYDLLRNDLLQKGIAASVTKTSSPLTQSWSNSWGMQWEGKDPNDKTLFNRFYADNQIVKTAGLEIIKGRDFDLNTYRTDSFAMIINEAAAKQMGFKEPLGKTVNDNGRDWTIIGVIKDFIIESPYSNVNPMLIEGAGGWFNIINIRYQPGSNMQANIKQTETIFKKYNTEYPFEYKFVDEEYARKFEDEKKMGTMATVFAILTIFISCLGLLGLSAYMAENRIKEIGIRKVLGASVSGIVALLTKEFMILVGIAFILATPLAWWGMGTLLEEFTYRINLQFDVFIYAGIGALLIALATISFQAVKAAIANPVRSLRSE